MIVLKLKMDKSSDEHYTYECVICSQVSVHWTIGRSGMSSINRGGWLIYDNNKNTFNGPTPCEMFNIRRDLNI